MRKLRYGTVKDLSTIQEGSSFLAQKPIFSRSCERSRKTHENDTDRGQVTEDSENSLTFKPKASQTNDVLLRRPSSSNRSSSYKILPPIGENEDNEKTEAAEDTLDHNSVIDLTARNNPDSIWITLLELNGSIPKPRWKEDLCLKQKNINLLSDAMHRSHHQVQGYLPPKDVVQLALAHNTVHCMGLGQGGIRGAIHSARAMDLMMGLVSIDKFIQALGEELV